MTKQIALQLTEQEAAAFDALVAGVGQLAGRDIDGAAAAVAALDLSLTRLIEDYELPDAAIRQQVYAAREAMRESWTRGNACL